MTTEPSPSKSKCKLRFLPLILKHAAAYLLGILSAILFTPADLTLAGVHLWYLYPLLAVVGVFFYYSLSPTYTFASDVLHWLIGGVGLALMLVGLALQFSALRRLRPLQPLLISFPIGFIGTLGMYYGAAQSI